LYTLSLFILEPIRWTTRFDWRNVNDVERCAMGASWRWLGEAMEIPYTALKFHKSGWTDGLQFLEELEEWNVGYEVENMVPARTNEIVSKHTIEIALCNIPRALHSARFDLVASLLEPRLRTAIEFKTPSRLAVSALDTIIVVRKLFVRHLCLPRPYIFRKR